METVKLLLSVFEVSALVFFNRFIVCCMRSRILRRGYPLDKKVSSKWSSSACRWHGEKAWGFCMYIGQASVFVLYLDLTSGLCKLFFRCIWSPLKACQPINSQRAKAYLNVGVLYIVSNLIYYALWSALWSALWRQFLYN